ncbi:MAG: hypothetical protein H7835_09785 [Magnetococcus sp. XQGC-1]
MKVPVMENAKETKNPLLETYGTVVDRFFAPGKAIQDPVALFPGVESASQVDELPFKPDLIYFEPGQAVVNSIQRTVEQLRAQLAQEEKEALQLGDQKKKFDNIADKVRVVRGQAEGIQQVSFHLEAFRSALQTGDESLLKGNPFYALTKLIFRHTLTGTLVLFDHLLGELSANAPEPSGGARSLRAIWQGAGKQGGWPGRLLASLGLLFQHSKPVLDALLFFVSAFTSYRALLALLQMPSMTDWLANHFNPSQGELLQATVALLGSLALTVAILDFRARLLQGVAEAGKLFAGLWAAMQLHPRWLLLAFCLTLFSVKANYDSIAVVFSTREYLSDSLSTIRQQVEQVLGTPDTANPSTPRSLHDLHARLQTVVADLGEKFARIPDDELNSKSSTTPENRKGPRYWAKHFIVNGGFLPGSNDVAHSFKNVQFARNTDQILKEAGVPLDLPLAQKMQTVIALYTTDLEKTRAQIQKHLAELDRLMQVGSLSISTVQKIYTFDSKHINGHIQEIVQALNTNRVRFEQVVQALDKLTESHIRLLAQVDRGSEAHFNTLRAANHLAIPAEVPLGTLTISPVQLTEQQGFTELSALLGDHYGASNGRSLMALILFLSFAIDWLPLLLFSRGTARQGIRDAQMAEELLAYMREWENALVELAKSFFYRPVIQQVFRGLTFPNETGVRNAFFKVLEGIDSNVKDLQDQDTMDQRRRWLRSLFVRPHTLYAMGYNARARAIDEFLSQKGGALPLLIMHLFPGLPYGKNSRQQIEQEQLLSFYRKTEAGQSSDKEQFAAELDRLGRGLPNNAGEAARSKGSILSTPLAFLSLVGQRLAAQLRRIPLLLPGRKPVEEDPWAAMMQKAVNSRPEPAVEGQRPTVHPDEESPARQSIDHLRFLLFEKAFREPYTPFPHTRRNWLIQMSSVDEESLEDLDTLHDFIPDFVKMLKKVMTNTLPIIQESLEPLEDIYARFPEQCQANGITETVELKERFRALEKESLGMWGACVAHLLGDGAHNIQSAENPDLAGMLASGGDVSQFYERIHTLMSDAKEAARRARAVEEATLATVKHSVVEIKELCDSIQQMLIKINLSSLELRRQRPLPHLKLRALNEAAALLERAPRAVKQILDTRERVLATQNLFSDDNYNELSQLRSRALALHNQVDNILNLVDK